MKAKSQLATLSTDALVKRFTKIALQQYDCVMGNEVARFNRLYKQMDAVTDELRKRPGDARRALIPLYKHPNRQVRLKAAVRTIALNEQAARGVLEALASETFYQQATDAWFALDNLKRGIFKPT